jgi:hypothetical protein
MASAPQPRLPLFYNDLAPLNSRDHGNWKQKSVDKAKWVAGQHAIPLTTDEFVFAHRHFPIVFSAGDNSVPLALMGLNEGINVFFDDEGVASEDFYVPAYIRRYPFLLARLNPDSEEMSLCVDPSSGLVGEDLEGEPMFEGDQASEQTKAILQFCQSFEEAGVRTEAFMQELQKADLLMDGELAIQRADNPDQPYVYRGFKMISQEKLLELHGDKLRSWNQNGILPLIYAHLFSLDLMRIVFGRQINQGKGPVPPSGQAADLPDIATTA